MKAETWVRVREVFQAAVELEPSARDAYLKQACQEPEVLSEVERLLREDDSSAEYLEEGPTLEDSISLGARVGRYTLNRVVGTGGMGTIFEATQDQPRRTVAVKMLRLGFDSPSRLRRFQYEAEVLGTLRHPGIAQIFEAGMHESQPYFAMELVPDARDLLAYAREERLSVGRRIALFVEICDAVSHGHQKGVIHRDLKPGNILVDADGRPKVIDFGVARVSDAQEVAGATETRAGNIVGTLQYMSPEQLAGKRTEVDVRSDVYALGCVLYELLVGYPPYELEDLSIAGVARTIEEREPLRPRGLQPDLVWILFKALEKDPDRRYASASEFRADLERFQTHEPVLAGPPSRGYRLRKFVRRNRSVILAVASVIVALSFGLVRAEIDARAAERARQAAELEAARARGVARFLRRTLTSAAPGDFGRDALVVDVLDEAARMVQGELADEPEALATVQHVIGDSYRAIAKFDRAVTHMTAARRYVDAELDQEDPFAIEVRATSALLLHNQRKYSEAEAFAAQLLPLAERILGPEEDSTMLIRYVLASSLASMGRPEEARLLAETNLEIRRRREGDGHPRMIRILEVLALVHDKLGEYDEALAVYEEILAICEERLPENHYRLFSVRMDLGNTYFDKTEWDKAVEYLRPCLDWCRIELGDDQPMTLALLNNLANALNMQGNYEEALPLLEEAVPLVKANYGEKNLLTVQTLNNLAVSYVEREHFEEAEEICYEAFDAAEGTLPEDHDVVLRVRMNLGKSLVGQERYEEAEEIFLGTWEMSVDAVGRGHPVTLSHMAQLVYVQKLLEDYAELELYAAELYDLGEESGRFREWSQEMLQQAQAALSGDPVGD